MSQVEYDVDEKDEKDDDKEETFVVVEDPPAGEDEGKGQEEDEDEGEGAEDKRAGGGREDDDDESKTARKGRSRKQRQRDARERTDRELKFLRNRNEQLERQFSEHKAEVDARMAGNEMAGIDSQITKARSDFSLAESVLEQALEGDDGKAVTEAMRHRDNIRDSLRDLERAKEFYADENNRGGVEERPRADPRAKAHADNFLRNNDWVDMDNPDRDSQVVLALDRELVSEGYDPRTKEHWAALTERIQEVLPHRFEEDEGDGEGEDDEAGDDADAKDNKRSGKKPGKRSKGPQFSTGGRERALKPNEVHIDAERKAALVEAGIWDNPQELQRYLKSYAKYDAEAAANRE